MSVVLLALALAASASPVTFKNSDGVALAADYIEPKKGLPVVAMFHGVAAGKGEWAPLASKLAEKGWGSLAVDFRGHGESGGPKFDTFKTNESWAALEGDVRAAVKWLKAKGIPANRIGLAGASIGANLAALAASKTPGLACAVLLSPGLEYHGVTVDEAIRKLKAPVLFAASGEDRFAFSSCEYLTRLRPGLDFDKAGAGHGAQMFRDADFLSRLLTWMDGNCRMLGKPASAR